LSKTAAAAEIRRRKIALKQEGYFLCKLPTVRAPYRSLPLLQMTQHAVYPHSTRRFQIGMINAFLRFRLSALISALGRFGFFSAT
jgi:hypothetical protein